MKDKFLQFLGLAKKAGKLLEGYNKSEEAIKKSKAYLVILSTELSENSKIKFKKYCTDRNIPCIETYSNVSLGEIVGRAEINVLCVTDESMSKQLIILNEALENNRG